MIAALGAFDGEVEVSFEFFPPKTEAMAATLWDSVAMLAPLRPRFVSVTYGAGGSTRERTHQTVERVLAETGIPVAAHLTCVGASADEISAIADRYWAAGVRHVVALRGDPPADAPQAPPMPGGYADAAALVAGLRRQHPFEISVAAYPEAHPRAASAQACLDQLKRKLDAGATRAITQFFFEAETFLRFRDRVAAAGITAELVPGILPVVRFDQAARMARQCGAAVPAWLARHFEGLDERPAVRQLVAATVAADLMAQLRAAGVRAFHLYTLNRAELAYAVCHLMGLRPRCVPCAR